MYIKPQKPVGYELHPKLHVYRPAKLLSFIMSPYYIFPNTFYNIIDIHMQILF